MVPKFTIIDDVTRAVVRVNDRLGTSWVLVPFVSRDSVLRLTVSLFVSVFARSGSLWDLFISPYSDSYVWSIVTKLAIVYDVTRTIVGIDCRFRSSWVLVPFVARDPVLRLTVGIFVPVFARTRGDRQYLYTFDTDCDIWCIISKFAVVYNVTWSIVWVNLRLRSAWTLVPFITRCPIFCQAISIFVSVLTRTRGDRDSFLTSNANSDIFQIITEFTVVHDVSRSIVGIDCRFRSTGIFVPFVARDPVLRLTVGIFRYILTWTWSYGNVFISPDSNCDILCIISKFAVVYNVTWSIVWVNLRLRPAWTLVPFMTRCPIFGQAISVFVSILARSRCQRNLRFAPYADSVIWKIISKLFSDSVGARSVVGIFFQFRSSRILVPLVGGCSVLGLPISFFVLILARPRTFVNFLLATHADRTLIEIGPEAESLIVV